MMVIKNSCVPVSLPANTQEQRKHPTALNKSHCQTIIPNTMFSFLLLVICSDFTSVIAVVLACCAYLKSQCSVTLEQVLEVFGYKNKKKLKKEKPLFLENVSTLLIHSQNQQITQTLL